jgi:hypothetical protein
MKNKFVFSLKVRVDKARTFFYIINMAKKKINKNKEFDGLTIDELKTKYDECKHSIDELQERRKKLEDRIHLDSLNEKLARIMGKWVKVKNFDWFDESNDKAYGYRVFKVVGVENWIQDNRFEIDIENGVYFGTTNSWDPNENYQVLEIIGNRRKYVTGDITKWQVISQKQARNFISKVSDKISKRLGAMQFEMGD